MLVGASETPPPIHTVFVTLQNRQTRPGYDGINTFVFRRDRTPHITLISSSFLNNSNINVPFTLLSSTV